MSHPRALRFGVQLSGGTGTDWLGQVRRAEELGYSSLFMPDHFTDQLAPVPALTAAAAATTTLRVGALVFDNDYRHPVVLAKELATIDVLSGGRVEIGLGAGWMATDYEQSGIALRRGRACASTASRRRSPSSRALMADGPVLVHRRPLHGHAATTALPKPVQRPHPPILIGGGGTRVLTIAAREADIVGINGDDGRRRDRRRTPSAR